MIESVGSQTAPASGVPPASTIFLTSVSCVASSPICGVPVLRPQAGADERRVGVLVAEAERMPELVAQRVLAPPLPITMSTRRSFSTSPPVASVSPTPSPPTRVTTLTNPCALMKSATPPRRSDSA